MIHTNTINWLTYGNT